MCICYIAHIHTSPCKCVVFVLGVYVRAFFAQLQAHAHIFEKYINIYTYICAYANIHICKRIRIWTATHTRTNESQDKITHTNTPTHTYAHPHAQTQTQRNTHVCARTHTRKNPRTHPVLSLYSTRNSTC